LQNIDLARISQEVMERFYNLFAVGMGAQTHPTARAPERLLPRCLLRGRPMDDADIQIQAHQLGREVR